MARYVTAVLAAATLLALTASTQAQTERVEKLLGTWTRHADGCKVKLEVKPDSLRCSLTAEDGIAVTVVADYVVSKDGILLGILHAPKSTKTANKDDEDDPLSKRLFYFQFTADDKTLVIKDLNYGDSDDKTKEIVEGKYHKTDGKHAQAKAAAHHLTKPSSQYLQHPPQYCPPAQEASPGKATGALPPTDPNRRISELLVDSEDLRNIEYEWERISFEDQPSHLTPERVHGGQTDWVRVWQFFTADALSGARSCYGWWVGK